jgi:aromatic ring-opening dioxygenase catalytic subunit (LigB family)
MAEIAFAAAAAHAPGVTGWFDKAEPADQDVVRAAYDRLGEDIRAARLDALLIVANDHILNYNPADYPDFVIGTAVEHTGPAEWFKPWLALDDYRMPGHPEIAGNLLDRLGDNGLLVVANDDLMFDDNISVPTTMIGLEEQGVPLVPIIQNCTVPPVPDERASYAFGERLGRVIRDDLPAGMRVGLLGSGGLSHEPGGPRYLEIDAEFDRWFLELLAEGDHEKVLRQATLERMEQAGAGGTAELLSWIVVMGAIGQRDCEVLGYVAVPDWRCGVGAVRWSVAAGIAPTPIGG